MQVFKAALRIVRRHPVYVGIYIIAMALGGVIIGMSASMEPQLTTEYVQADINIAVIDRDHSPISQGITTELDTYGTLVEIEDSERALQDCAARNTAAFVAIIPENYGNDFVAAVERGEDPPAIECVTSFESISGNMMHQVIDEYLGLAATYIRAGVTSDQAELIELTSQDMEGSAPVLLVQDSTGKEDVVGFETCMDFFSYTAMLGMIVIVSVVMSAFREEEMRRRVSASPISSFSANAQLAFALAVLTLVVAAFDFLLAYLVFHASITSLTGTEVFLSFLNLLCITLVGTSIGFLIGQITGHEGIINAVGNIAALVTAFLGGVMVSLSLLGEPFNTIARFTPSFYYLDSLLQICGEYTDVTSGLSIAGNMCMVLLFALVLVAAGLLAGRLRGLSHGRSRLLSAA